MSDVLSSLMVVGRRSRAVGNGLTVGRLMTVGLLAYRQITLVPLCSVRLRAWGDPAALTDEQIRYWWRELGAGQSIDVALDASPTLRRAVPRYPEPSARKMRAARELIAADLAAAGGGSCVTRRRRVWVAGSDPGPMLVEVDPLDEVALGALLEASR